MSISITLLGHSPKKRDGHSSGGDAGAGMTQFLHLAYANSEDGEGFTKTNINSEGHIAFFPYIGVCLSDDRDDESLSFNSYKWNNFGYGDASSQQSGTPSGSGNNGSNGNNGQNGSSSTCKCDTCCNYKYCGGDNGGNVDPLAILDPQTVDYDIPECIHPKEGYVMNESNHLLFDDEVRSVGYDIEGEEGAKSIVWHVWLKCKSFHITIEKALDLYQGWIYYADITDFYSEVFNTYVNLNQSLTKESGYTIPEDPQWHNVGFEETPVLKMNNNVPVNATSIEDGIAKWNNTIIESIFGPSKTDRLHECHCQSYSFDYYAVYDTTIRYRWKAKTYEEIVAMLPKMFTLNYKSMQRIIPFTYTEDSTSKLNIVTLKINNSKYYDSSSANKQGARIQNNQPTYTGWQNDWYQVNNSSFDSEIEYNQWARFYNGYDSTWLSTIYPASSSVAPISYIEPTGQSGTQADPTYTYVRVNGSNMSIYEQKTGELWTWERQNITPISKIGEFNIIDNGNTIELSGGIYYVKEDKDGNLQPLGTFTIDLGTYTDALKPANDYSEKVTCLYIQTDYPDYISKTIDEAFGAGTSAVGKVLATVKEDGKTVDRFYINIS